MADAYYCDGRMEDSVKLGDFPDLEAAKAACLDHAQKHREFRKIMLQENDGEDGWDAAVQLGTVHIRLYFANA